MIISGNASAATPISVLVGKVTPPQVSPTHWVDAPDARMVRTKGKYPLRAAYRPATRTRSAAPPPPSAPRPRARAPGARRGSARTSPAPVAARTALEINVADALHLPQVATAPVSERGLFPCAAGVWGFLVSERSIRAPLPMASSWTALP